MRIPLSCAAPALLAALQVAAPSAAQTAKIPIANAVNRPVADTLGSRQRPGPIGVSRPGVGTTDVLESTRRRLANQLFINNLVDAPVSAPSAMLSEETHVQFGYGGLRVDGRAAIGDRPLLLLVVDVPGSTIPWRHPLAYYDSLIFGPRALSAAGYFSEMSRGAFTWSRAGAMSFRLDEDRGLERNLARAKEMAGERGFDFARFDRNRDGTVGTDELGVVVIDNGSSVLGATRRTDPQCVRPRGSTVSVCSDGAAAGEGTRLDNVSHEMSHLLGTTDLYGSGCYSSGFSLMGCTANGPMDQALIYHLDPWHKMRLGWVRPRVYRSTDPGGSAHLGAVQVASGREMDRRPILLYDPRRGMNEYFLLEYRAAGDPGRQGYDVNVAGAGLVLWHVLIRPTGELQVRNAVITGGDNGRLESTIRGDDVLADGVIRSGPNVMLESVRGGDDAVGDDAMNVILGAPGFTRGTGRPWLDTDGEIRPRWIDGTLSGLVIRAGRPGTASAGLDVEWGEGASFVGYIAPLAAVPGPPGYTFSLDGSFGIRASKRVTLVNNEGRHDLEVLDWSQSRVTVRIPANTPAGDYALLIRADPSTDRRSNAVRYTVRAGS